MKLELSCSLGVSRPLAVPFVGALDDYLALLTGVWSLVRLLVSSYTGPLVRLRRVSDSVEMDFYPLANGRVDEAGIVTFRGASSLVVVYVYDQLESNDWVQASGSVQPAWVEGVSEFNDAPAMYLAGGKGMTCGLSPTKPYSILLTECNPAPLVEFGGRTLDSAGGNRLISSSRSDAGQAFDGGTIAAPLVTAAAVCEVLVAPAAGNYAFYSDGADVTSGSVGANDWGALRLGSSGVWGESARSNLVEMAAFNTALSGAQVTVMQAIFNPAAL